MDHPKCRTCGERHRLGPCDQEVGTSYGPPPKPVAAHRTSKAGRKLAAEAHLALATIKPWFAVNPPMSRASWYRRQKAKGELK